MKIADVLEKRLMAWLRHRGVNASYVSYDQEVYEREYGAPAVQVVVYYHAPNGERGSRIFDGDIAALIDELDALEVSP